LENAYGARSLLQEYMGLLTKKRLSGDWSVWQHGWLPPSNNKDIDLVIGESGETSSLTHLAYFVARQDQVEVLRSAGIRQVYAVGLPFAYALKICEKSPLRQPKSLLVMPSFHGLKLEPGEPHPDEKLMEYIGDNRHLFDAVTVLMNCDEARTNRAGQWRNRGFTVEVGGCERDTSSLTRLVNVFSRFETMMTNGFGSHIVYAAASGCRISIQPTDLGFSTSQYLSQTMYINRPDLIDAERKSLSETRELFESLGLYVDPPQAIDLTNWGKEQIGYHNCLEPSELRNLLASAYRANNSRLERLGLGSAKKKLVSISRFIELSRVMQDPMATAKLRFLLRNLFSLVFSLHKPVSTLRLLDSGQEVVFRHTRFDRESLRRHFLDHELRKLNLRGTFDRILDFGCYVGYSTSYLSSLFPAARIVAVEADWSNYSLAKLNLAQDSHVKILNKAIWSETGTVSLLRGPKGNSSTKTIPYHENFPSVSSLTLEDLLTEEGWSSVDLIKIDIEGAEYDLLGSVVDQVADLCSVLVVNFYARVARRAEVTSIINKLRSRKPAKVSEIGQFTVIDFR